MAHVKAVVVSGPEAIDGKLVFGVSVDGLLVTLSTYRALVTDADRESLVMTGGQAYSPRLYEIAQAAVVDYALARQADRVRRAFEHAKMQPIRLRMQAQNSWPKNCPRCDEAIVGARLGSVVVCDGCHSSILFVGS